MAILNKSIVTNCGLHHNDKIWIYIIHRHFLKYPTIQAWCPNLSFLMVLYRNFLKKANSFRGDYWIQREIRSSVELWLPSTHDKSVSRLKIVFFLNRLIQGLTNSLRHRLFAHSVPKRVLFYTLTHYLSYVNMLSAVWSLHNKISVQKHRWKLLIAAWDPILTL